MSAHAEPRVGKAALLDDIEKRVSEIFSAQKSEVEQSLIERITREKEEAQRRIEAVNREFAEVRGYLDEHKTVMAELQTTEDHLRGEIRGHFERAMNYQKMMENAAALAGEELERIGGLNGELEKVRVKAERVYDTLKKHLAGYAGVMATIPAPAGKVEGLVDWTEELVKLRKVRDLLATLRHQPEPSGDFTPEAVAGPAADPDAVTAPVAPEAEELAASLGLIDIEEDGIKDDHDFIAPENLMDAPDAAAPGFAFEAPALVELVPAAEPEPEPAAAPAPEPEPAAEAAPEAPAAAQPLPENLARYRRTESVNNGIELGFFASEAASVLDAGSFMVAVGKVIENASQLHGQLGQAASVKDLFLLKQEILNQQEILRKVFFRVVRFCDKENGRLPEAFGEVISSQGMKDVIERLTMANWSDPSDFKPFQTELKALTRAFETRTAANSRYYQQVLDQVEGREN